jgi:hypothetical protein
MTGKTIRLFIKALIIGTLVNMSIQYVSTPPLSSPENSSLHKQAPRQAPLNTEFQATDQAEK